MRPEFKMCGSPVLAARGEKAPTGALVKGRRGEEALSENKDMGGKNVKMREKEKDQKRRSWQRLCVGLKSWHLPNRAAALGAKRCQPAPLA